MAKQPRSPSARKAPDREDSLLLRSAENLGRIIGTLQRQLEAASRAERKPAAIPKAPKARKAARKSAKKR